MSVTEQTPLEKIDEAIQDERDTIRRLKQYISDYQRDLKTHKEKLHGLVAARKVVSGDKS